MADAKSSERNLESKHCADVADEDNSLPPVRSASQQNYAHKVSTLIAWVVLYRNILPCGVISLTCFWATVCKMVCPMLSDHCPVCLSILSVMLVYCVKLLDGS